MLSVPPAVDATTEPVDVGAGQAHGHSARPPELRAADRARIRGSILGGTAAGFVPYLILLWDFRVDPLRRAGAHGFASNFYDLQARAVLAGHLWVPDRSLGLEGFVVRGHTYMYFPPLPALLRIPVLMLTDRFDGQLTAPMMVVAWLLLAAATATLFWNVRGLIRGAAPVSRAEAWLGATFLAALTGGSVILFLAALPWVYHEAYLWATAFSVATLAGLVVFARRPTVVVAGVTGAFAVATILTRTTSGWALALTGVVVGALAIVRGAGGSRRAPAVLVASGVLAIVVGAAINWAKFRHPYMFPLEHQEWTRLSSRRRLALMMNGGSITGPQFLPSTLVNYFRPDGIRFTAFFPFVSPPSEPARSYGGAIIDQAYRTGSVPAFAPLLFVLGIGGLVGAVRVRFVDGVHGLLAPVAGAVAAGGGVMLYGYIAYRYTADFVPAMAVCGSVAVVLVGRWLTRARPSLRRLAIAAVTVGAVFGIVANGAAGIAAARTTWRGQRLERYLEVQHGAGDAFGRAGDLVVHSSTLDPTGSADELRIIGDCQALYLATGDQYEPWIAVELRDLVVTVEASRRRLTAGLLPLIRFDGVRPRDVSLEIGDDGRVRYRVGEAFAYFATDWLAVRRGQRLSVTVRIDTELDRFDLLFDGMPDPNWYVSASDADAQQIRRVARPKFVSPSTASQRELGVAVAARLGPRPELCDRLLDDVSQVRGAGDDR